MSYASPKWWIAVLMAFAIGGAALGLGLPAMKKFAAAEFGRAGYAVFLVINIALPLLVVTLSAVHPRYLVALGGTVLAVLLFLIASGFRPTGYSVSAIAASLRTLSPIFLVACVVYLIMATGTVAVANLGLRVGFPPDPMACIKCGYKLIGLREQRCPECFEPFGTQTHAS